LAKGSSPFVLSEEERYGAGISEWDKMRFAGGINARSYYQNIEGFASGRELTAGQRDAAANALASAGVQYQDLMQGVGYQAGRKGAGALTTAGMSDIIAAQLREKGMSAERARTLSRNPDVIRAATHTSLSVNSDLGDQARQDHYGFTGRVGKYTTDQVVNAEKSLADLFSSATHTPLMDHWGIGTSDVEATKLLKEASSSEGGSVHASKIAMITQLSKTLRGLDPKSADYKNYKGELTRLLEGEGLSFEGFMTDPEGKLQGLAQGKYGMSDTAYSKSVSAGSRLSGTVRSGTLLGKQREAVEALPGKILDYQQMRDSVSASGYVEKNEQGEVVSDKMSSFIKGQKIQTDAINRVGDILETATGVTSSGNPIVRWLDKARL
jgi:hypothetical protein